MTDNPAEGLPTPIDLLGTVAPPPAPEVKPLDQQPNEYDALIQAPPAAPAKPAGNEYDGLVVDLQKARDQRASLGVAAAKGANPDATAKAIDLAGKTGIPVEVAERNLPAVEQQARVNEYDEIAKAHKGLGRWLAENPVNARVASDDFANIGMLEHTWDLMKGVFYGARENAAGLGLAVAGGRLNDIAAAKEKAARGEYLSPWEAALVKQAPEGETTLQTSMTESAQSLLRNKAEAEKLPVRPALRELNGAKTFGDAFGAFLKDPLGIIYDLGVQSSTSMVGTMAGIAVGGPVGGVVGTGLQSFGSEFVSGILDNLDEMGVDTSSETALKAAFTNVKLMSEVYKKSAIKASVVGTIDAATLGIAGKTIAPRFATRALTREAFNLPAQLGVQMAGGAGGEAGGSVAADRPINPGAVLSEAAGELFGTPAEVAAMRHHVGSEAAPVPKVGKPATVGETRAEDAAVGMDKLMETAQATKLAKRSPAKLEDFMNTVTADSDQRDVFVPVEAVTSYLQSLPADQATKQAEALGISAQLAEAQVTGGDIVIPIAKYLANGSDAHKAWREDMRVDADGFSLRQAKEDAKVQTARLKETTDRFEEQLQAGMAEADAATRVFEDFKSKLTTTGQYTNDIASQYATLMAERYEARAQANPHRFADAWEAYQQAGTGKGVDVQSMVPEGVRAYPPDQLDVLLNAVRTGKKPKLSAPIDRAEAEQRARAASPDVFAALDEVKGAQSRPIPSAVPPPGFKPDPEVLKTAQRLAKGWTPERPLKRPQGLTEFVRKNGGMRLSSSEAGDMLSADVGRQPGLLRAEGRQADHMAQAAKDAGFDVGKETATGSGVDVEEFMRRLIEDASGKKRHEAEGAETEAYHAQQRYFDHYTQYIEALLGGQAKGMDANELAYLLSQDPDTARLMRLGDQIDELGDEASQEVAYLLDGELAKIERAELDRIEALAKPEAFDAEAEAVEGEGKPLTAAELKALHAQLDATLGDAESISHIPEAADASGGKAGSGEAGIDEQPAPSTEGQGPVGRLVAASKRSLDLAEKAVKAAIDHHANVLTDEAIADTAREQLRATLEMLGLDPAKMSNEQIRAALQKAVANEKAGKTFQQPARGEISFTESGAIIRLFQDRDMSTLLHETGHLWLEELGADAKAAGATDRVRADWQTVLDYVGSKDGFITTEQHELMARSFEAYLMEGKAPTTALAGVFRRFKSWLVGIYKSLKSLDAPITPEIREVFDRLIASDEAIAHAKIVQGLNPIFKDAKSAGMTETEFRAYTRHAAAVVDEAEQKVLADTMKDIRAQRTKEWREEEGKTRAAVTDEVWKDPGMGALHLLTRGELFAGDTPDVLKGAKLDRAAVTAAMGDEEALKMLPASILAKIGEKGVDPALVGNAVGLADGRELIERLMKIEADQKAMRDKGDRRSVAQAQIAEQTAQRMKDAHGDPLNDGSIETEAMAAVHSEKQAALLQSEMMTLARKSGLTGAVTLKDIQAWAANAIGEMSVYNATQTKKYQRAERLAGQKVERALVKGDTGAAFKAKQDQLVNHALYMESAKAAKDVDAAVKLNDRYASKATIKNMDQDALDQIHQLQEKYDFKKRSGPLLTERTTFAMWAAEQQEKLGIEVEVPPRLGDPTAVHYTQMTTDELRGLTDTIKQIAHIGRMKQTLIDNEKKRQFEEVIAEGVKTAGAIDQRGVSKDDTGLTPIQEKLGKLGSGIRSFDASLLKIETMMEWLDHDKTGRGIFTRMGFRPLAAAQHRENDRMAALTKKQADIFAKVPVEQRAKWLEVHDIPALGKPGGRPGRYNHTQLISMALNIGNQSNLDKMLGGYKWNEEAVRTTLDKYLTKEEWQAVQDIWDLIDTQWPDLEAVHKRMTGTAPPKIEALEVPTPYGTLKGGYYKAVYDPNLSIKAEKIGAKQDLAATVGQIFPNGFTRPTTRAGATHARTGFEAPIRLSLDVIPQQLRDAAHDIEFREAVINAHRFFDDDRIKAAIGEALGPEYEAQIEPWLKNIAHEWTIDRQGLSAVQNFASTLRMNVTMVGMGLRVTTMMAQSAGLSNSTQRLGKAAMAEGMKTFSLAPLQQTAWVREKSGEMQHRANEMERDMRANLLKLQGKSGKLNDFRRFAYSGIALADAAVSIPTWLGAYNQGLKEHGMTDADAVYYADKMVRDTQGSGGMKDMSAAQRGGPIFKLMMMFYSYFNVYYNRQRGLARDVRDKDVNWGNIVHQTFFLLVLPSLLAPLLSGQGPDKDEDWAAWAARNVFFGLFTGVPYGRDLANAASNKISGKNFGGPKLSPVEGFGENLIHLGVDVAKMASGEDTSKTSIKNLANVTGVVTGLPLGQPGGTLQYVWDTLVKGSEDPQNLLDWMKGLTFGPDHSNK